MYISYLGFLQTTLNWVLSNIFSPVFQFIGKLLGTVFSWIFDTILSPLLIEVLVPLIEWTIKLIFKLLAGLLYNILVYICEIIDLMQYVFDILIGVEKITYIADNGVAQQMPLIEVIFAIPGIRFAVLSITLLGVIVAFMFSTYAVIKSMYDIDFEGKKPVGQVLRMGAKAALHFMLVPTMCYFVVRLCGVLTYAVREAIPMENSATLGAYVIGAALYRAEYEPSEIEFDDSDTKKATAVNIRDIYYSGNVRKGRARELMFENAQGYAIKADSNKLPKDNKGNVVSGIGSRDAAVNWLKANKDLEFAAAGGDYHDYAIAAEMVTVKYANSSTEQKLIPKFDQNGALMFAAPAFRYWNTNAIEAFFDIPEADFITGFVMAGFMAIMLGIVIVTFVTRFFEVTVLYVASPIYVAYMPLDDGEKFGTWRTKFIAKVFTGLGGLLVMRLFLLFVPMIMNSKIKYNININVELNEDNVNYLISLLFVLGLMWATMKTSSVLTYLFDYQSGVEDDNLQSATWGKMKAGGHKAIAAAKWARGKYKQWKAERKQKNENAKEEQKRLKHEAPGATGGPRSKALQDAKDKLLSHKDNTGRSIASIDESRGVRGRSSAGGHGSGGEAAGREGGWPQHKALAGRIGDKKDPSKAIARRTNQGKHFQWGQTESGQTRLAAFDIGKGKAFKFHVSRDENGKMRLQELKVGPFFHHKKEMNDRGDMKQSTRILGGAYTHKQTFRKNESGQTTTAGGRGENIFFGGLYREKYDTKADQSGMRDSSQIYQRSFLGAGGRREKSNEVQMRPIMEQDPHDPNRFIQRVDDQGRPVFAPFQALNPDGTTKRDANYSTAYVFGGGITQTIRHNTDGSLASNTLRFETTTYNIGGSGQQDAGGGGQGGDGGPDYVSSERDLNIQQESAPQQPDYIASNNNLNVAQNPNPNNQQVDYEVNLATPRINPASIPQNQQQPNSNSSVLPGQIPNPERGQNGNYVPPDDDY